MTDNNRSAKPSTDKFKYYLEVNDTLDTNNKNQQYPRQGYARFSYWDQETGYTRVIDYIQEQDFPTNQTINENDIHAPISRSQLGGITRPGWETGPSTLWDLIETVRDEYYEKGIDPSNLPVRVLTYRQDIDNPDTSSYDEECEIHFTNGQKNIEFIVWHSDEFYGPADNSKQYNVNSEMVQKIIAAFAQAYEEPDKFLSTWGNRGVEI